MSHPNKSEAASSSRAKMRAITGRGGGGTPFLGMSPFKRVGAGGETQSYHSHDKQFVSASAGGRVKPRADKFARGGRIKKAGGGPTGTGPAHPDVYDRRGRSERFEDENPDVITRRRQGPMGSQKDSTTPEEMDVYQSVAPGYERDYGHVTPGGVPIEQSPKSTPDEDAPGSKRGGRAKRANGGRTMMPYGPETQRSSVKRGGKKGAGNVNIAIMMPERHHPGLGGGAGLPPPMPPGGPPGGLGGGPGAGPPTPAPAIPPALMGGAMPGAMPGGMPGGANPAAMQALSGIAGGAGPMGAGLPGRGPFARGGSVKSSGLSSNLAHWREYSNKNVKGNTAQDRGATGESEELPLRTPDHVRGASDAKIAKRRGDRGESGKYAAGGKIPVKTRGGSETGVGRKNMAKLQPSWRRS